MRELVFGQGFYKLSCTDSSFIDKAWKFVIDSYSHILIESGIEKEGFKATKQILLRHHSRYGLLHDRLDLSVFNRTLCSSSSKELAAEDFIQYLSRQLGMKVTDSYGLGYPTFTWRITRPGRSEDFRDIHRDCWFRLINGEAKIIDGSRPGCLQTCKAWLSLHTVKEKSGLLVSPYSHKRADLSYDAIGRDGIMKPLIKRQKLSDIPLICEASSPNEVILFGEDLIHGGAPNISNACRISLEIPFSPHHYQPFNVIYA